MIKKIILTLVVLLAIAQVVRPTKNNSRDTQKDISTLYQMTDDVKVIVNKACADCHTNNTNYPFYANIQPIAYWLEDHVKEGKRHFNFNEFASYRIAKQNHKLEEVIEQIKEGEMPLYSYTWIHKDAVLNSKQVNALVTWAKENKMKYELKGGFEDHD